MKGKISFLAQFPPPIHGLSKAVDTLYKSELKDKYSFEKIDISDNKKFFKTILSILTSKAKLFYFTISQTKGGNIRDLLFLKLIQLKKKKCIVHLHGGYYRELIEDSVPVLQKRLNYKLMSKVDAGIVLSPSLKPIFGNLLDDKRIFIVPNCVDDEFVLEAYKLSNKFDADSLNVLYLSNFIESKGYKEVLELARLARENQDIIKFHFAGKFYSEEDEMYFKSFIKDYELHDYVNYHGIVSGKEKANLLSECHVFILLTRYPNEGQPISILEAMANAQVIITTNHAGIPDIITDHNGFVANKNNIKLNEVYSFLLKLKDDKNLLIGFGQTNYELAKRLYTQQNYIQNMDNVFSKVISYE